MLMRLPYGFMGQAYSLGWAFWRWFVLELQVLSLGDRRGFLSSNIVRSSTRDVKSSCTQEENCLR